MSDASQNYGQWTECYGLKATNSWLQTTNQKLWTMDWMLWTKKSY